MGTRANNFDFTRLMAALLVLFSHQQLLTGRQQWKLWGTYSLGDAGVAAFFCISGFLIARSWHQDPHGLRFFLKRFLRIWPALAVAVLVMACVMGPWAADRQVSNYWADPRFLGFFKNLIMVARSDLPVAFAGGPFTHIVNGSLWTIPLEVRCYVLLAITGMLGLLNRRVFYIALACASLAYVMGLIGAGAFLIRADEQGHSLQLEFILCFCLGMCAQHLHQAFESSNARAMVALASLGVCALAWATERAALGFCIGLPGLVLAISTSRWRAAQVFGRYGDLSYGVYLYAFPVQQIVIWQLGGAAHFAEGLAGAIAITLGLAFLSWHGVEKHALRFKPKTPSHLK